MKQALLAFLFCLTIAVCPVWALNQNWQGAGGITRGLPLLFDGNDPIMDFRQADVFLTTEPYANETKESLVQKTTGMELHRKSPHYGDFMQFLLDDKQYSELKDEYICYDIESENDIRLLRIYAQWKNDILEFDNAYRAMKRAEMLDRKEPDKKRDAYLYSDIGNYHDAKDQSREALRYYDEALRLLPEHNEELFRRTESLRDKLASRISTWWTYQNEVKIHGVEGDYVHKNFRLGAHIERIDNDRNQYHLRLQDKDARWLLLAAGPRNYQVRLGHKFNIYTTYGYDKDSLIEVRERMRKRDLGVELNFDIKKYHTDVVMKTYRRILKAGNGTVVGTNTFNGGFSRWFNQYVSASAFYTATNIFKEHEDRSPIAFDNYHAVDGRVYFTWPIKRYDAQLRLSTGLNYDMNRCNPLFSIELAHKERLSLLYETLFDRLGGGRIYTAQCRYTYYFRDEK